MENEEIIHSEIRQCHWGSEVVLMPTSENENKGKGHSAIWISADIFLVCCKCGELQRQTKLFLR